MPPFKVVYGRDPLSLVQYVPSINHPVDISQLLQARNVVLDQLKRNLLKSQECMKRFADAKCTEVEFHIGDHGLFNLQNFVQLRKIHKLGLHYFGPFPIIERIGSVAYRILLLPSARMYPIFHVSLLKKCVGIPDTQCIPLPLVKANTSPLV